MQVTIRTVSISLLALDVEVEVRLVEVVNTNETVLSTAAIAVHVVIGKQKIEVKQKKYVSI